MKVISIVNPKGGAGKTVTAVNLAYAMSLKGKKILLIDTDPRNAVSTYLNLKNDNTIFDLIKECYETMKFDKAKYITSKNKVDVIISDERLLQLEMLFASYSDNQAIFNIFSNITEQLKQDYDYIIIDTEGSINNTVRGILNATDYIVAPSKCSLIDTNGINDLIKIYFIGKRNNPKLELKKVVAVMMLTLFSSSVAKDTDRTGFLYNLRELKEISDIMDLIQESYVENANAQKQREEKEEKVDSQNKKTNKKKNDIKNTTEPKKPSVLTRRSLMQGAIKGMVESLDDPHSTYFTKEELKSFQEDIKGKYVGVGMVIQKKANEPIVVVSPIEDGPAYKVGVKPKDKITEIDGKSTYSLTSEESTKRLKGKANTTVKIKVFSTNHASK